ncbi:MAG: amidohydrolase [SAR202 cluster bacterium]|nr:amidohydrolase [SAR202 cluster bacterium]
MWKGMKVIDADAHMHEPEYLWDKYVESQYHDQVPKVAFMDGIIMVYEPDGHIIPKGDLQPRPSPGVFKTLEDKYGEAYRQWWSPEIRLSDMDQFGWDIQVCLPTGNNGNFAYRVALKDVKLGAAMCRAYNNWCADYCGVDAKRLKFTAVLPGGDVEEMVTEARRAVKDLGAVSVRNPLLPTGQWLHSPANDPLWTLACELDFPISIHGEYRQRRFQPFAGIKYDPSAGALEALDHALGFPCDNMTTMGHFIFSGMLDRFASLRLAILESNAGWLPFWLGRMDEHSHGRNSMFFNAEKLPMTPSEYVSRQCYIACDGDERALKYVVDYMQGENLVWNTDYPHPDAPNPVEALPDLDSQAISNDAKRKILWDNSVILYGQRLVT